MFDLLNSVDSPARLRTLHPAALRALADELRAFILGSVSATGGHLSANLGTIELTVALHYIFNTPDDRIVWDVGHQAYAHKILTGRREEMGGIRQFGGISGFPRRSESSYDCFGDCALEHIDFSRTGHGPGGSKPGAPAPLHRRDRRRCLERRHGL